MMQKSTPNRIYRAIGLMSGTAMDGIDAALIETDGYGVIKRVGFETENHDPKLRERLKDCLNCTDRDNMTEVERDFTLRHVPVIQALLEKNNLTSSDIDIIGFHGQTVHHDPDHAVTIQLGDGDLLAQETGIDVVYDIRQADVKAGGQGAPLLPVYHRALALNAGLDFPIVIANIGGVSNITWINDEFDMIAFDTGPGNAMIDDWVKRHTGESYDTDGTLAQSGEVSTSHLDIFLSHSYFTKHYPKSLDRNDFADITAEGLSLADGAATFMEMTVQAIAKGIDVCPQKPTVIYVTGGGRHNTAMMARLAHVTNLPVRSVDDLGWNGDSMEAEGFAYMAVRKLLNEPISFPKTTRCHSPMVGGVFAKRKEQAACIIYKTI